jgi:hypothetical protein
MPLVQARQSQIALKFNNEKSPDSDEEIEQAEARSNLDVDPTNSDPALQQR